MGPEQTDRDTVRRAQQGDHAAYGVLVRRYQYRIYRYLVREALGLTQDAFIKAWEALPGRRPEAQFHTWVFRIASNAAMDALRRRKVVGFVALEEDYDAPAEAPGPEGRLATKQRLGALDAALGRIPLEQREVIVPRDVEGLSYGEIRRQAGR